VCSGRALREAAEIQLIVTLVDGRRVSAPLAWFPRLLRATSEQRANWCLIGRGVGILFSFLFLNSYFPSASHQTIRFRLRRQKADQFASQQLTLNYHPSPAQDFRSDEVMRSMLLKIKPPSYGDARTVLACFALRRRT
jgi:Protein of unknown function (DUF2442)